MRKLLLVLMLGLIVVGCEKETEAEVEAKVISPVVTDEGDTPNNEDAPRDEEQSEGKLLDGMINGRSWTFISGRVRKSEFGSGYSFNFWNINESDPCDRFAWGSDTQLIGRIPLKVGTHKFGNMINMTFFYNNNNLIATTGKMVITEITDDKVIGHLETKYNGSNYVSGEFELNYCK